MLILFKSQFDYIFLPGIQLICKCIHQDKCVGKFNNQILFIIFLNAFPRQSLIICCPNKLNKSFLRDLLVQCICCLEMCTLNKFYLNIFAIRLLTLNTGN